MIIGGDGGVIGCHTYEPGRQRRGTLKFIENLETFRVSGTLSYQYFSRDRQELWGALGQVTVQILDEQTEEVLGKGQADKHGNFDLLFTPKRNDDSLSVVLELIASNAPRVEVVDKDKYVWRDWSEAWSPHEHPHFRLDHSVSIKNWFRELSYIYGLKSSIYLD